MVEDFLWVQADQQVHGLRATTQLAHVLWDDSVLEKPESLKAERLCAVRASKAVRLKRIKPGYLLRLGLFSLQYAQEMPCFQAFFCANV